MSPLRIRLRTLVLTGVLFLATATAAQASTYYVSPAGSDSNPGTSTSAPWRTVTKASGTILGPGDQVLFQGGQTFTGTLAPKGSGTSASPTVYASYGTGKATISGMVNPGSQHDVTVSNLRVDGGGGDCIHSVYSGSGTVNLTVNAVEVYHCAIGIHSTQKGDATWTIKNSYIHDTSDSGLILWGSAFLVADNSIQHTGNANLGYGTHGIYSKSPSVRILRNDIAFYRDNAISTRFRNALIEGNKIHDGDIGIAYYNYDTTETPGQGTSVIRYNKIWNMTGPNGYGILITGGSGGGAGVAYQSPENWRIYANTIVGGGHGQAMWLNPINATELTIQNNIVTGSWGYGMLNVQTTPTRYAEDHNNWAGTSIRSGTANINTNPNLSPAPALVPQSDSPVIDTGSMSVPGATYTNACDGQPLSYCGTTADIGAIETGPVAPSAALRVSFKVRGGKLLKRGYLYVVARCSQPCRLTAQAQEQIKKRRRLGTRRRTLVISNPAKARTVRLKLNTKDRRLGKRRRLVLKVSVTARATSGGPTAIASRKLTVRRKRR